MPLQLCTSLEVELMETRTPLPQGGQQETLHFFGSGINGNSVEGLANGVTVGVPFALLWKWN